jgi:hypothetical protein
VNDLALQMIFNKFNIPYSSIIFSIVHFNPLEIAVTLIAVKLGLPKVVVLIVLAFLA